MWYDKPCDEIWPESLKIDQAAARFDVPREEFERVLIELAVDGPDRIHARWRRWVRKQGY